MIETLTKLFIFVLVVSCILVYNIKCLKKARALKRDVRQGHTRKVRARVTRKRRSSGRSCIIYAQYEPDGSTINGRMVCASDMVFHKSRNDEMHVIVGRTCKDVFALDEKQIMDAVLTWWVLSGLALLADLVFITDIITYYIKAN